MALASRREIIAGKGVADEIGERDLHERVAEVERHD